MFSSHAKFFTKIMYYGFSQVRTTVHLPKNVVDNRPRRLLLIYYVYALYTVDVPLSVKGIVIF